MKVGILTYHWEDNYGAVMQAYATQRLVAELGHQPQFIDLRLPYKPSIAQRLVFALKHRRFDKFRKQRYTGLTPRTYRSVEELRQDPPLTDAYLVGSDQTWNPNIASGLLPAFFLTFGDDKVRRLTFATSIGQNEWEGSQEINDSEIRNALDRFDSILLREDSAIRICREKFGHEAQQVVDPVLMFADYPELTGSMRPSGEVITYKLIDDPGFYDIAKGVAEHLGLPVRSIGSIRRPKGFRHSYPEKIENWIKRIGEASLVLTDSFHGTVFSLLYHRPFVVYIGNPTRTTRIYSLLEQLGLSERILSSGTTREQMIEMATRPIDWDSVDARLAAMRSRSWDLIRGALK